MKKYIILLIFSFQFTWGQTIGREKELLSAYSQYDIVLRYNNDYNTLTKLNYWSSFVRVL